MKNNPVLDLRQIPALKKRGKSKYYAVRTAARDGTVCDSKKEAAWHDQIMAASKAFHVQVVPKVRLPIHSSNGRQICVYVPDWSVYRAGKLIAIIDCKGFKVDVYRLKKKFIEAEYGLKIVEDLNEALKIITGEKK